MACVAPPSTPSLAERVSWADRDANMHALYVRIHGFYELFYGRISRAADDASRAAASRDERRELLLWKSDAVALLLPATYRADSIVAMFDQWTLCVQLEAELGSADTQERLGAGAEALRIVMGELIEEIESIAATILVDEGLEPMASMVAASAEKNPIEGPLYTRVSGVGAHADLALADFAISDVVGLMASRVDDLTRLAAAIASDLPRMIRWETELLLADDLESLTDSAERMALVAERIPALVERERGVMVETLAVERATVLASIDQQRIATVESLRDERVAVTEFIRAERVAILEGVDQQRLETVAALGEARVALVDQFGDERRHMIEEVTESLVGTPAVVRQIVDHFFLRVVQLGAVLMAILVLAYVGRRTMVRG